METTGKVTTKQWQLLSCSELRRPAAGTPRCFLIFCPFELSKKGLPLPLKAQKYLSLPEIMDQQSIANQHVRERQKTTNNMIQHVPCGYKGAQSTSHGQVPNPLFATLGLPSNPRKRKAAKS